jgi:acyl carrier protein
MNVDKDEILSIFENVGISIEVSSIKSDVLLREIGVDSLEMMNVLLQIEEKFNVKIPDEEIDNLVTIDNIVSYLQRL